MDKFACLLVHVYAVLCIPVTIVQLSPFCQNFGKVGLDLGMKICLIVSPASIAAHKDHFVYRLSVR